MIDQIALDVPNLNVLSYVDLADLTNSPSAVYKLFNDLHREEFQHSDRIVFYTSQEIPDLLWRHLYQAANQMDISNFFILICSPTDLAEKSQQQVLLWSSDCVPFQTQKVSVADNAPLGNNYHVPDTICPLPWTHLEIKPNGNISPCCVQKESVGNIIDHTLTDVFVSKSMQMLRTSFLNGELPSGCRVCWKNEADNVVSNRQRHYNLLSRDFLTNYIDLPQLTSIDLKAGNTCNFKCRICGPAASSLWAQEKQTIPLIKSVFQNWADEGGPFQKIFDHISTLNNYDFYGGEPFLIKSLTLLIEKIVKSGRAPDVRLHYNSNGSIYPEHLLEHWKHFKHIDLHFSIDNIGKKFELERGGKWDQVNYNIQRLLQKKLPNLKISIMPVINVMNVLYIDELFTWARSLDLNIDPLYLKEPSEFSIEQLTSTAKHLVLSKYQKSTDPELQKIAAIIESSNGSDGKKFVERTRELDALRNQSFHDTHQEIAEAMGYTV
jgi:MoaA/NifB/PqqE/SkfB family radical SAM enzyme